MSDRIERRHGIERHRFERDRGHVGNNERAARLVAGCKRDLALRPIDAEDVTPMVCQPARNRNARATSEVQDARLGRKDRDDRIQPILPKRRSRSPTETLSAISSYPEATTFLASELMLSPAYCAPLGKSARRPAGPHAIRRYPLRWGASAASCTSVAVTHEPAVGPSWRMSRGRTTERGQQRSLIRCCAPARRCEDIYVAEVGT